MKKILFVLVLVLLIGIVGLRVYNSYSSGTLDLGDAQQAEPAETAPAELAADQPQATPSAPAVYVTPEPTPYDPKDLLDLESVDEATAQEILQTEEEWASQGGGVGQITPATESDNTPVQSTDQATIDIGEGQGGMIGF